MSTITFDFRHYYRKGERRESDQIAYQWDLGHVAEIYVPVNATYEIHYCFSDFAETDDYAVESVTEAEDGGYKLTAHIPNKYFERSGELKVYVIGSDDNHVLTTYEGYISIRGRIKPDDYTDDDPENEATRILAEAREARDAAIEAAEQAEAAASQSAAQASIAKVYDATKTYAIGDYCLHDGQLYECTTEITTPEAWTAAHWTAATVGTELNDIKGDVTGLKEDLTNTNGFLEIETAEPYNLINMAKFTVVGQYYANASGVSGAHTDNNGYISYDALIAVKPSTTYTLTNKYRETMTIVSLLMIDESKSQYLGGGYNQAGQFTTTDATKYIRISVRKAVSDLGEIMLEEGTSISPTYIPYFEPYTYASALEQGADIVCWGDSLTYGTGKTSDSKSYPAVLSKKTGRKVRACAFPGDTSIEIVGMQGAAPMMVKAPFTIPASGSVTIDIYDALLSADTPFRFPSIDATADVNPVTIGGIKGNLDLSASSNPDSRTFTFTRLEDGEAKSFTWWEPLATNCSKERKTDIAVIWVGTNGGWDGDNQTLVRQIKQMSEYISAVDKKYIVIGLTTGTTQTRSALEALLTNTFGGHFVNARAYMSEQAIYDQNITPTENDLTQMSEGRVPESLRYDATHLNDKGYDAIATLVYNRGKSLGYWG